MVRKHLRRGLSQEALAELANLHRTDVGQIGRGNRRARIDTAVRVAEALHTSLARLTVRANASEAAPDPATNCRTTSC